VFDTDCDCDPEVDSDPEVAKVHTYALQGALVPQHRTNSLCFERTAARPPQGLSENLPYRLWTSKISPHPVAAVLFHEPQVFMGDRKERIEVNLY
jgi:hypothetical protein